MSERDGTAELLKRVEGLARVAVLVGCGVAAGAVVLAYSRYVASGAYIDHIEATMTILDYNYLHGHPIYDLPDGIMRFSALYGPFAYLTQIAAMWTFGLSVLAAKLAAGGALLGAAAVLLHHFRSTTGRAISVGVMAYVIGGLAFFHKTGFWIRAEPFITLLVAVAVVTTERRRKAWILGLCMGAAVNFKIHAAAFFIPLVLESLLRERWRDWMITASVAALVVLSPFILPGIDPVAYLRSVHQHVGGREVSPELLMLAVWTALIFCLPILFVLAAEKDRRSGADTVFIWSTLGTVVLLAYPASLQGAGAYHYQPLVPVLVAAYVRARPVKPLSRFVPATLLTATLLMSVPVLWHFRPAPFTREMTDEILVLARDPTLQPLQIGFGATAESYATVQASRVALTLAGNPPVVDAQVLMELGVRGVDGSARWVPLLRQCAVKSWLIPSGERPFQMIGYYAPEPVFGAGFRAAFQAHYRFARNVGYFDLWECRRS